MGQGKGGRGALHEQRGRSLGRHPENGEEVCRNNARISRIPCGYAGWASALSFRTAAPPIWLPRWLPLSKGQDVPIGTV